MKIIRAKDYADMSRKAAAIIAAQVVIKPDCVLGLATGSSPVGAYKQLIEWYNQGDLDFSDVTSVNLDEYVGLTGDHEQSYRYFMNTNLFDHINIDKNRTHVPSGVSEDVAAECQNYENLIRSLGGIDLQLLGIGHDGHIGFNEPESYFSTITHCVELNPITIKANARFFASEADVPTKAVTMGIETIMAARKIVLIASGADKKEIMEKAFFGPVTPEVPASILQMHPDLTIVTCDTI